MSSLITFSSVVIGSALIISSLSKLRDLGSFEKTIADFQILPLSLHKVAARVFMIAELCVAVSMGLKGKWLHFGFLLATFLFFIFTVAIVYVLARGIRVACNCFGSTTTPVSRYEVIRNSGFIFWGIVGWVGMSIVPNSQSDIPKTVFLVFLGLAYIVFWINLPEIISFLKENK